MYIFGLDSFCWPKVVAVRAFSTLSFDLDPFVRSVVWSLKVIPLSWVVLRIFVDGDTGI